MTLRNVSQLNDQLRTLSFLCLQTAVSPAVGLIILLEIVPVVADTMVVVEEVVTGDMVVAVSLMRSA